MKKLLRSRPVQRLLLRLFQYYLWFVLRSTRWTIEGGENLAPHAAGAPAVFGFWHEYLSSMPAVAICAQRSPAYRSTPLHALVSRHRDGQLIGEVLQWFGIHPVHGSSTRGGAASMRILLRLITDGAIICISPDGPRGPRRQAAAGVAQLAALAGVPILPCAVCTSRGITLNSWDRMWIPFPFGRGLVVCGPEIRVPKGAWRDALPAITDGINQAANRADQLRDHP